MSRRKLLESKLGVYVVSDTELLKEKGFMPSMRHVLEGGVKAIQLREKDCTASEFLEKAKELRELTQTYGALFFVNDRIDIALLSGADGVHIGQKDVPLADARCLMGEGAYIGVSVQTVQQAVDAEREGADYVGVGAMFSTERKKDAIRVTIGTLQKIREAVSVPIVLIGGLTLDNRAFFSGIKVEGYAVISAILGAEDIQAEAEKWVIP
ncbi:thiamine phosphate synthase [Bacillus sp. 1P06AnD]|uniref:thiamine phosphate synthase n=1 Tax=Bacillus sp. 1P06AnD TaxID=3132208 RepID=UPI0039A057AC